MMSRTLRFLASALVLVAAGAGADPGALLQEVRDSRLDPDRAVEVGKLSLQAGQAELKIVRGTFFPATPVGGRVVEMVFVGEARLVLEPPDDIEAGQLELFTGNSRLDEDVREAVLVVAVDAASEAIYKRPPAAVDAAAKSRARELFDQWRAGPVRRLLGVETALLRDALGDPFCQGYFTGWFRSEDLGEFLYVFEPDAREQVTLGKFTPLDATEKEKRKLERAIHQSQRRGRLIGFSADDLGQWDTWVSAPLRRPDGTIMAGAQPFEPELYELDVELSEPELELKGRARIHLRSLSNAARVVKLDLYRDLKIDRARVQGESSDLFFHQAGGEAVVLLPEAPSPGAWVLELEYSGHVIEKGGSNTYLLSDTTNWYPHTGDTDRARYDVTLHWPAKLDLVAAGHRVDGGEEDGGRRRFERRRLEHPTFGFSFEVGRFKTLTARAGHVDISLSLDPLIYPALTKEGREEILSTVVDALAFFEETFGPYPLDELAVVTAPRAFSQGFLGFVTLSTFNMTETDWWTVYLGFEDRRTVIAHELAHQWWGHMVAWESYRDQWISEAMANYAAVLYARKRLVGQKKSVIIGPTSGWQSALTSTSADGRPIESLGPLVLGERLESSRSGTAYEAIVYKKGAVVLDMLSRYYREDSFLEILRKVVEAVSFHAVSTETFIALFERLSGQDLDGFARQFIYGSGLPDVYYTYDFAPTPEGKWLIQGVARQESPYRYRYRVLEHEDGSFDVARERLDQIEVTGSSLVVPIVVAVFNPEAGTSEVHKREKLDPKVAGNAYITGRMLLRGRSTDIRFEVELEPKELWLDKNHEVFGQFYNERRHPKRMLLYQGLGAAAEGDHDRAETLYRQALAAETFNGPVYARADRDGEKAEGRQLDAAVQLQLARVYLDRNRLDAARAALAEADKLLTSTSRFWYAPLLKTLEARLAIRTGDPERAYKLLRKGVLRRGDLESAEGALLLAIAARATGHAEDYEKALEMAREKDSDVTALTGSG